MKRHTRGGYWNAERDRSPGVVVNALLDWIEECDLDWVLLQETADYLSTFKKVLSPEFWIVGSSQLPGMSNTCILVSKTRHPRKPTYSRIIRMTKGGWTTTKGGHTPPKYMPTCKVFEWLVLGSVHYAPSVHQTDADPALDGPVRRVLSYRQHAYSELAFWKRRPRHVSVLVGGDRNNGPGTTALWAPRWLARKADAKLHYPSTPTHHRATIDGALGRNVRVVTKVLSPEGSDHHRVLVDVYED